MDNFMVLFLYVLLLVVSFILTKIKTNKYLHINTIYTVLWFFVLFFSMNNNLGLLKPRIEIYLLVLVSAVIFNVMYLFSYKKVKMGKIDYSRFNINTKKIVLLNIIAYILFFPSIISAIKLIISSGLNLVLIRNTIYVGITESTNAGISSIFLRTIPTAIFNFTEIMSAYYLVKKENKKIVIMGFVDLIVGTLIFGGRNFLLNYIIFYFFNYINNTDKKLKLKKRYILVLIIILFLVTSNRDVSNISFIQTIILYFAGSLSFLELILSNPLSYGLNVKHYGNLTFGFIVEPIVLLLKTLFRLDIKVPSYYFNVYAQKFVNIGSSRISLYNNNTTFWYPFMLDFGFKFAIVGAIIFFMIICFVTNKKNSGNLKYYFIYIYLSSVVINSSVSYKLIGLSSSLIIALILFCIEKRKNNEYKN